MVNKFVTLHGNDQPFVVDRTRGGGHGGEEVTGPERGPWEPGGVPERGPPHRGPDRTVSRTSSTEVGMVWVTKYSIIVSKFTCLFIVLQNFI